MRVEMESGKSDIVVEPYVLPSQSQFSTPDAFNRASGPNKWNRQQGFYIYRADRMIQSGGWSNLRTLDEHHKLARVALSFSPRLDEEFKINVPKMRVSLPSSIKEALAQAISPVITLANKTYRSSEKSLKGSGSGAEGGREGKKPKVVREDSSDVFPGSQYAPDHSNSNTGSNESKELNFEHVELLLEKVALPEELPVVRKVFARAKATLLE
ncbi:hypothetical protein [Pseudomonas cedrina]|uniref:hypothetical protein n=1 Tax=Pseudomonas cedrina TaxID=651740 RepID=UPI001032BC7C|nr:hypothetical protein [Pseudomonas cedrina]